MADWSDVSSKAMVRCPQDSCDDEFEYPDDVKAWVDARKEVICRMRELGVNLNDYGKTCKVASSVGNGIAAATEIASVGCLLANLFKPSEELEKAGSCLHNISRVSSVATLGIQTLNRFLEERILQEVQDVVSKDLSLQIRLKRKIEEEKPVEPKRKSKKKAKKGQRNMLSICPEDDMTMTAVGARMTMTGIKRPIQVEKAIEYTLRATETSWNVKTFVRDIIELNDGDFSEAATKVMAFADELEQELYNFESKTQ